MGYVLDILKCYFLFLLFHYVLGEFRPILTVKEQEQDVCLLKVRSISFKISIPQLIK